jgi:hypothetical protein
LPLRARVRALRARTRTLDKTRILSAHCSPTAPGDTITLEKGVYNLDKTVVIEDDLTIQAAEGCEAGDVVITASAPVDSGHFAARKVA